MSDKNVKVQWEKVGGNDLDGSMQVDKYKVLVGLQTYGVDGVWMSDAEKRKVVLFLHCVEPNYYEIYEDVHDSLADALNWLQNLKESEVIEMIEEEERFCNRYEHITKDDKKLQVGWFMGEEHDIHGCAKFGEYDLYIGICETHENKENPKEVSLFVHCGKPHSCELLETTLLNTAVALNVIANLSETAVINMVKGMMK